LTVAHDLLAWVEIERAVPSRQSSHSLLPKPFLNPARYLVAYFTEFGELGLIAAFRLGRVF
jgi:hypothetical protein